MEVHSKELFSFPRSSSNMKRVVKALVYNTRTVSKIWRKEKTAVSSTFNTGFPLFTLLYPGYRIKLKNAYVRKVCISIKTFFFTKSNFYL